MSIQKILLRLYPRQWRQRYGEEMLTLLEATPLSALDAVDMLLGAIDAHMHPLLGMKNFPIYERILHMLRTLRQSLLTVFCAYIGFVLAGMGFQKMTEYDDFVDAAHAHTLVGISYTLVVVGAAIALLAILVGGLPIACAVVKEALTTKRPGPVFLLAIPVVAFAVLSVAPPLVGGLSVVAARISFIGVIIGLAVISTAAVCIAVARSQIPERLLRFAVFPSMIAVAAMILILAATIIWGIGLQRDVPQLFGGNDGIFGTSTSGTWIQIVVEMAIATLIAAISLARSIVIRSALPANA